MWLSQNHVCLDVTTDNMATIGASKGGSAADDDGGVATCWRPAGPCTSRSFAAARSVGGPGGPDGLETAWGTLELQFERGSNVARPPSACGRMRLVAELLLGPQSSVAHSHTVPASAHDVVLCIFRDGPGRTSVHRPAIVRQGLTVCNTPPRQICKEPCGCVESACAEPRQKS